MGNNVFTEKSRYLLILIPDRLVFGKCDRTGGTADLNREARNRISFFLEPVFITADAFAGEYLIAGDSGRGQCHVV